MDISTDPAHFGHSVSVVYRCFQQCSVEHSHTRRPGSGQPRSKDARRDQRIVRATVAARTASREEIRAHVAPAISQGPFGTVFLQKNSDHVCLWLGYHLHHNTAKHGYSGVVKESPGEWNGFLSCLQ